MIFAFAIEPVVAAEWYPRRRLRTVRNEFGVGHPRVFFEYPKFSKWKRAVWRILADKNLSEIDRARVEVLFTWLGEARVRRHELAYDPDKDWLSNVEAEWDRRAFGGVLASCDPRKHAAVITEEERLDGDARWDDLPSGLVVKRTPEALRGALGPLVQDCREVHLVDPYFDGSKRTYQRVLADLAGAMCDPADEERRTIVVHCGGNVPLEDFVSGLGVCAESVPRRVTLEVRRWWDVTDSDGLHNRFVLTDIGGVKLGWAVASGRRGTLDDVNVLARGQWETRWAQYCEGDQVFEPVDDPPLESISGRCD
jgi:hypothetical protein